MYKLVYGMEILSRILESAACGRVFLERNLTGWVWKVDEWMQVYSDY